MTESDTPAGVSDTVITDMIIITPTDNAIVLNLNTTKPCHKTPSDLSWMVAWQSEVVPAPRGLQVREQSEGRQQT